MSGVAAQNAGALRAQETVLAQALVEQQFALHPELDSRYGPLGRRRCLEDARHHLSYLAQAVESQRSELFGHYVGWVKIVLAARRVAPEDFARQLSQLRALLRERLPQEAAVAADRVLEEGLRDLPGMPLDVASFLDDGAPLAEVAREYVALLRQGDRQLASELVMATMRSGATLRDIYLEVFQRALREIGRLWQLNLISVAQEHYCTAATQMIMSQLYPHVLAGGRTRGTLVATCVAGNLHEVGIRMLADMFELHGWKTFFLGSNMPDEAVLAMVAERGAQVLAISATLAPHVGAVHELIVRLRTDARFAQVRVIVGGHPFQVAAGLWKEVGADGHAADADEAIALAERLVLSPA